MSFNWQVRFGLCKQQANYAFSHRAGYRSAHCAVRSASLFEERLQNSQTVGRSAPVPSPSCFSSNNILHACIPLPSSPSLSFSQLTHFTKLPNERTCHLLCVMFFSIPSLSPSLPSFFVTFTCSALSSPGVHSDSAASSSGGCWLDRERGGPGSTETCLHLLSR